MCIPCKSVIRTRCLGCRPAQVGLVSGCQCCRTCLKKQLGCCSLDKHFALRTTGQAQESKIPKRPHCNLFPNDCYGRSKAMGCTATPLSLSFPFLPHNAPQKTLPSYISKIAPVFLPVTQLLRAHCLDVDQDGVNAAEATRL